MLEKSKLHIRPDIQPVSGQLENRKIPSESYGYLADKNLADVGRLVECLVVDGLLALNDGGQVHQPAREVPAVKLYASFPV